MAVRMFLKAGQFGDTSGNGRHVDDFTLQPVSERRLAIARCRSLNSKEYIMCKYSFRQFPALNSRVGQFLVSTPLSQVFRKMAGAIKAVFQRCKSEGTDRQLAPLC